VVRAVRMPLRATLRAASFKRTWLFMRRSFPGWRRRR
jgi:hypothetical protein